MRGGLQVCGTGSDVGKSRIVTGLGRLLVRRGVSVAPFKAQNMALNSAVAADGGEIGRAQAAQAFACGIEPETAMNPILLKPSGDRTSQVIVKGRPVGHLSAAEYHELKPLLLRTVLDELAGLRQRFDVVLVEGAGSPTEINLLDHDIVNLRIAAEAGLPAIVVGDIDRGGVFASLYGTVALLPDHLRGHVRGFVVNRFRGDPSLLADGFEVLRERTGVPTLGVVPMAEGLFLDAEDSLALDHPLPTHAGAAGEVLDVAVIRLPRISNFTDIDALALEPGLSVRFVTSAGQVGRPDLIVVPGTKATVDDLAWLRARGLDGALVAARERGATILGICGGYQMLGGRIDDEVESGAGSVPGLGLLDVTTTFGPDKVTRRRRGRALDMPIEGYEIHHGRVARGPAAAPWILLDDDPSPEAEGAADGDGQVRGTIVHGLFENDALRTRLLREVADRAGRAWDPSGVSFAAARQAQVDAWADLLDEHLDVDAICDLIAEVR